MIVLGINETHCATAAVLRDGRVVGCASEERFTRLKNDAGYPRLAIDALLEECGLTPADVDVVALAGARAASREWLNRVLHDETYAREYYGVSLPSPWRALGRRARKLGAKLGLADPSRGKFGISQGERLGFVTDHLGIPKDRIVCLDHHTCHAAAAYYGSGFAGKDALVLTNDNSGDGLCATVSTGRGADAARGGPVRARIAGGLLFVRDARPRHEVRRARVQGHGHGALRVREARPARRGGASPCLRSGRRSPRALPLASVRRAVPAPPRDDAGPALRRGGGRRPAAPRRHHPPLGAAHAPALRGRARSEG